MSLLVYIEIAEDSIKKSSLETAAYANEVAKSLNTSAIGIVFGKINTEALKQVGNYGIKKIFHVSAPNFETPSVMPYASAIAELSVQENVKTIILSKSSIADSLVSRLAIKLKAGVVTNVVELPNFEKGFEVKRSIYTGKAFSRLQINTEIKILTIAKNAFSTSPTSDVASVEEFNPTVHAKDSKVKSINIQKASGDVLLTEADLVVSGGRGFKGPENWGILLDLAKAMKAGTGCSKPVSDMDWRPHHEHVGQTGVKVSPNLYIAVGISGAIQHLAGVNSSKVIVVINKDPEAPFFKAADYGICGDLFEILPKLTNAAKNYFN